MFRATFNCCLVMLACLCGCVAEAQPAQSERKVLLILGDSLTAGLGLENPMAQAYPALLQEKIDEAGLPWRVVNAGLSGDTSAGGLRRIDWLLRQRVDLFLLALGGNDGLRGIQLKATRINLANTLERVKARYPSARLYVAGMQMPPNLGPEYTGEYRALFGEVAREGGAELIPFLLEGVGGVPDLNQADGIHPNAEGHRRVALLLWRQLRPVLENKP